jgi:hypothetical protein
MNNDDEKSRLIAEALRFALKKIDEVAPKSSGETSVSILAAGLTNEDGMSVLPDETNTDGRIPVITVEAKQVIEKSGTPKEHVEYLLGLSRGLDDMVYVNDKPASLGDEARIKTARHIYGAV